MTQHKWEKDKTGIKTIKAIHTDNRGLSLKFIILGLKTRSMFSERER